MAALRSNQAARIVFVTCPDLSVSRDIAAALIDAREAACVNILPGLESVYRWQGQVETDAEILLLIKTTAAALPAVQARVASRHPDDVPEFLAVMPDSGAAAYLDWLEQQTCAD